MLDPVHRLAHTQRQNIATDKPLADLHRRDHKAQTVCSCEFHFKAELENCEVRLGMQDLHR
jgi:hypothetical protein